MPDQTKYIDFEEAFLQGDTPVDEEQSNQNPQESQNTQVSRDNVNEPTQNQDQQPDQQVQGDDVPPVDRLLSENQRVKQQLQQLEAFEPIIQRFRYDPNFQQAVLDLMQGQQVPNQQQQPQEPQFNFIPPRPPEDFDPYEMGKPDTSSGKYFQQLVKSIYESVRNDVVKEVETVKTEAEQIRAQQEMMHIEQEMFNDFLRQHPDLDQKTAVDFWNWAKNPENVTVDVLLELYRIMNNPQNNQSQQQQQQANVVPNDVINKLRKNAQLPQTQANQGGGGNEPLDENQLFSQDLLQGSKEWLY